MFRNSHATVGQSQGRVVLSARKRAGSSATPGWCGVSPRFGLSLTEVLISMGILTMGLLGVASVFPVASFYMQKGDVADRGSAIAQGAFNEVVTNGTLNPENWLVWADSSGVGSVVNPTGVVTNTFTRPFAEMIRRKKAVLARAGTTSPLEMDREFGSFIMIDPIGVASVARYDAASNNSIGVGGLWPCGNFPSSSPVLTTTGYSWKPWEDPNPRVGIQWPIRRVSLKNLPTGGALSTAANRLFTTADDLSLDLPGGQSKPSVQSWERSPIDLNNDGNIRNDLLTRQARGDYSWIVTVAPTSSIARDALATDPSAHSYEVSVVVFHKRPLGIVSPPNNDDALANKELLDRNEQVVRAKVLSTGLTGGELLLEQFNTTLGIESPYANLKSGNWVLLCGPHPGSTSEQPLLTARWYQVLAIEGKIERLNANGDVSPPPSAGEPERRLVSLRGPEWPWDPAVNGAGNPDLSANHLSNSLYVCIPTGAVAVHSKTIRLGGDSMWAGGAGGLGKAAPIGTAPPADKAPDG